MTQIQNPKLTAEYWGGNSIFDEALFEGAPHVQQSCLSFEKLRYAQRSLLYGVGQVALGNSTEIRYGGGNEFNPDIADGSLVVVDRENITRWVYNTPGHTWSNAKPSGKAPAITRPYSAYWLQNQDGDVGPNHDIGSEAIFFDEEHTMYLRQIDWGIIVSQGKARFIQPFLFSTTKLLPDGAIHTPTIYREDSALAGRAIPMPVSIGEVQVGPRLTLEHCAIDALERVRSVDIVYPAAGSREAKRDRKFSLGKLALPKLRANPGRSLA